MQEMELGEDLGRQGECHKVADVTWPKLVFCKDRHLSCEFCCSLTSLTPVLICQTQYYCHNTVKLEEVSLTELDDSSP